MSSVWLREWTGVARKAWPIQCRRASGMPARFVAWKTVALTALPRMGPAVLVVVAGPGAEPPDPVGHEPGEVQKEGMRGMS